MSIAKIKQSQPKLSALQLEKRNSEAKNDRRNNSVQQRWKADFKVHAFRAPLLQAPPAEKLRL